MAHGPTFVVKFRRRREERTDYRHRLRQVISGKPRIVVKLSNRYIWASLVFYKETGDVIKTTLCSKTLSERGFSGSLKNTPSAYAFGLICAKEFLKHIMARQGSRENKEEQKNYLDKQKAKLTGKSGGFSVPQKTEFSAGSGNIQMDVGHSKEAIIDLGRRHFQKGGRISAFIKGLVEGGMQVGFSEEAAPNKERLEGKHLKSKLDFAKLQAGLGGGK